MNVEYNHTKRLWEMINFMFWFSIVCSVIAGGFLLLLLIVLVINFAQTQFVLFPLF